MSNATIELPKLYDSAADFMPLLGTDYLEAICQ